MTLRDFADRISELVWGGERGWIDEGGLQRLADTVRHLLARELAKKKFSDLDALRPAPSETFELNCPSRSFMPLVLCAHCAAPLDGNGKCLAVNEKKAT